jgi:hypothetical protein
LIFAFNFDKPSIFQYEGVWPKFEKLIETCFSLFVRVLPKSIKFGEIVRSGNCPSPDNWIKNFSGFSLIKTIKVQLKICCEFGWKNNEIFWERLGGRVR